MKFRTLAAILLLLLTTSTDLRAATLDDEINAFLNVAAMPFLPDGAVLLPFSWPGRYSHSPVEVADLRDVESLVELIVAVAAEPAGGSDRLKP